MLYNYRMDYTIVLGSASPRRKELLAQLVGNFTVCVADVDEACILPSPAQHVMYTAYRKSHAIPLTDRQLLITADTLVCLDNLFLGKPTDEQQAVNMLNALNHRLHHVYTGVCLRTANSVDYFAVCTTVRIDMTPQQILQYVATGSPLDKAGAYGIQDPLMHATVTDGSLSNVIGLPQEALARKLQRYI